MIAPSPWVTAQGGFVDSPDTKDARSQQWNIDIERQFSSGMLLSVAYVGSRDTRLDYTGFANAAPHANPNGTPASVVDAQKLVPWLVPTIQILSKHRNRELPRARSIVPEALVQRPTHALVLYVLEIDGQ